MDKILQIPSVAKLIAGCWADSENALCSSIREKHPDLDEVFITRLFHDELRQTFKKVSDEGKVEEAFLKDLRKAFPIYAYSGFLGKISSGLVASVTLHPTEIEKRTGGDLGLLLARPNINESCDYGTKLVVGGYRRGLLCQAKIRRRDGKWGEFSENQEKILANHLDSLALLLYEYSDVERKRLSPFQWQLCEDSSFSQVQEWIKVDRFPLLQDSEQIISSLGENRIGTDNSTIIEDVVCPKTRSYMTIDISWPGKPRDFEVRVNREIDQKQKQDVYVKV